MTDAMMTDRRDLPNIPVRLGTMKNQLLDGRYYGDVLRRGQVEHLILSEIAYPPNSSVPSHSHANAYFCKVLQGTFTETYDGSNRECDSDVVAFHPPQEVHSERNHSVRVRSFHVEITDAYLKRVRQHSDLLDGPADFRGGNIGWLATKLYREFVTNDAVSALAIEGLILELISVASRTHKNGLAGKQPGTWLQRARDILHAHFAETLTISEIAVSVEIHPVHLAREFHRHYHCTIGEYLRRLRVDFACTQIKLGKTSLAEVAVQAGFFDQSHLSRTFRTLTGMTPGEYRSVHRRSGRIG